MIDKPCKKTNCQLSGWTQVVFELELRLIR